MSDNDDYRVTHTCPHCGVQHTGAGGPSGPVRGPEPGDFALCVDCGEWNVLGDDNQLRKPTEAELEEIGFDDDCRRARAAWVRATRSSKQ
jgi:hypothetical protein